MAKRARPGILDAALGCSDPWHKIVNIRDEICPTCGGLPDEEDEGFLGDTAEIVLGVVEAVRDSGDDHDDD